MGPLVSSKGGGFHVNVREVEVLVFNDSCSGAAIGAMQQEKGDKNAKIHA